MNELNLENVLGSQPIEITCPGCGHKFSVAFREVMREGNQITCSGCHQNITISHAPGTSQDLGKADRALKDFGKTIKNFGRR